MGKKRLLDKLADEIAAALWLQDDLIVREVRDAEDIEEATERLLAVRRDVAVALRILKHAR